MPCSGCGGSASAAVGTRMIPFPQVEGDPVVTQVRFPNGVIRRYWARGAAETAVRDFNAVIIETEEVIPLPPVQEAEVSAMDTSTPDDDG